MGGNKYDEVKDKVVGGVKEIAGKVTNNESLELKGKLQKGVGKAREVAGDVVHEMEDVKDKVVGGVKEVTGKYTDNRGLEIKGKIQRMKVRNPRTNKIIFGVGAAAGLFLAAAVIRKNREKAETEE